MQIAVTGSHGLIGNALVAQLEARADRCCRIDRPGLTSGWERDLDGADAVVHLAGRSIGEHRWSKAEKEEILRSRVRGTSALTAALISMAQPPQVLISASAIGYYGSRSSQVLTERSAPGTGFLAEVCQAWEEAAEPATEAGIRTVYLRSGIVQSADGGALARQLPLFRWGLGGHLGSGDQHVSWISLSDEIRVILHLLDHADMAGPVNAVAPQAVSARDYAKELGKALRRPALLPVPRGILQLVLGRELADQLVLSDQRVVPEALMASGFQFSHPDLESCFCQLFERRPSST